MEEIGTHLFISRLQSPSPVVYKFLKDCCNLASHLKSKARKYDLSEQLKVLLTALTDLEYKVS